MDDFHLKGEDDSFKSRSNDIYSCFDNVKSKSQPKPAEEISNNRKRTRRNFKHVEPGFKTEPDKWVKYSLESTDVADDRQNTQAALSFLHDLAKRSKPGENAEKGDISNDVAEEMDTDKKIAFKKPSPHTMSEHVVGQCKLKSAGKPSNKTRPSFDKVELDHLEENVSAVEYRADIEAKLEETLQLHKKNVQTNAAQTDSDIFKSSKSHKTRNIRKRK